MRMRKKPNLPQRMEKCGELLLKEPEKLRGNWLSETNGYDELHLEIGCGKGRFTCETAKSAPNVRFAAVEKVPDAMIIAMERAAAESLCNIQFIDLDASKLCEVFAPDEISRIYLNFSDPWPARRHAARRLTSGGFLHIYKQVLKPGGEIWFKTDNRPLFAFSVSEFEKNGFSILEPTMNLHEHGVCGIMTDYEQRFHEQGIPINRCVAKR